MDHVLGGLSTEIPVTSVKGESGWNDFRIMYKVALDSRAHVYCGEVTLLDPYLGGRERSRCPCIQKDESLQVPCVCEGDVDFRTLVY